MFGKTYGKLTDVVASRDYHKGSDVRPKERYTSLSREAHVNLREVKDKSVADIVGVKPIPVIYKAPIPKRTYDDFYGVDNPHAPSQQFAPVSQLQQPVQDNTLPDQT